MSRPSFNLCSLATLAIAVALAGCAVGPDLVRPALAMPAQYKESGPWKPAEPQAADSRAPWWEAYRDDRLTALIGQAELANQNLRLAEAQYREAQAVAAAARAGLFPTVGVNAGGQRARANANGVKLGNVVDAGASASWEPDLWGSVRRSIEVGNASAEASADDLAAVRLSIQAALALDYLQLRVIDLQRDLYAATIAAYTKSLQLTQSQYKAGVVLRSDVALAESQLKTAEAAGADLEAQRAQFEHAIAILIGQSPAAFELPAATAQAPFDVRVPSVPTGLPSELLERRPDIAAAERRVTAANANVGVAQAAFFPSLVLSASGGFSGASLSGLFDTPGRVWSLGAALAQTVFDGGLRRAHSDQAIAAYDAAVAQYKQTVLTGFQQVEDNLATLRVLAREAALQDEAVKASQLAERLALTQYRAGTASYLSVVTAQTLSLTNQRAAVQLLGRQLAASVNLVSAIGGGWRAGQGAPVAMAAP